MPSLKKVKEAYLEYLWENTPNPDLKIDSFIDKITEDDMGDLCFSDIDYDDRSRTQWQPSSHVSRILSLLRYYGEAELKNSESHRLTIERLIRNWTTHTYKSDNWYHRQISVPLEFGRIAMMVESYMPDDVKEALGKIVYTGTPYYLPMFTHCLFDNWDGDKAPNGTWVGANFIWGMNTTFMYALFMENEEILKAVHYEMDMLISKPKGEEGMKPDHSFYQHKRRWYSGGYCNPFLSNASHLIHYFLKGDYLFSDNGIASMVGQYLECWRYISMNGNMDFNARGRFIAKKSGVSNGPKAPNPTVVLLINTPHIPRKDDLKEYIKETTTPNEYNPNSPIKKTVYFPYVSHLSHIYGGNYFGITCINKNQLGAEHCNKEAVLCYNMSYGTRNCFMASGIEYRNVHVIWDYSAVPGTTSYYETDEELLARDGSWSEEYRQTERDICFGKTQGDSAILTQEVNHDGISLYATYFAKNGRLVVLGSDIKNESGKEIYTTIDQCYATDVEIHDENSASCGGFTYYNLNEADEIAFKVEHRKMKSGRNDLSVIDTKYEFEVEGDVFQPTIYSTGNTYAYAVTGRGKAVGARILFNDACVQGVEFDDGQIQLAFHEDATIEIGGTIFEGKKNELYII